MHKLQKKILSKIYSGYGFKYYPIKFQKKLKLKHKYNEQKNNTKVESKAYKILNLASSTINVNPQNIWQQKNFSDREDFSSLHRWTWAVKLISVNKLKPNIKTINFIENSILNWCHRYSNTKIDIKNIIFEPYNISERICNYLLLIKLKILKPNNIILYNLEKQYFFLLNNIECYKYKLSNHALNNLRAIYLFSIFNKNKEIQSYSLKFIVYLLTKFLNKDGFFKFGSSNYQFIFAKWITDILFFSINSKNNEVKLIKKHYTNIVNSLYFFIEKEPNNKISIPLFGNVSPDLDNDWIIGFFFKREDNFFFARYWKKFNYKITNKKIYSKEWVKIKKNDFSIYTRNPKLIGFDFNHSHNDFFHFVLFYKGKSIIIDSGRKNYSYKSLLQDISGKSHNSICLNNKAIYDDYLIYSRLYRLGLKNEQNCKYSILTNYKDFIKLKCTEKNYTILREIKILENKIQIIDKIKIKKPSDISLRFHLNMTNKNINYNNSKLKFNFSSNEIFTKNYLPNIFYKSYGSSFLGSSILIKYKKKKNIIIKTMIEA